MSAGAHSTYKALRKASGTTHLASNHLLTTLLATNAKAPRPAEARRPKKAFLGLEVTPEPPHLVTKIIGLMDENSILHTNSKYSNPQILPGDRILKVDGRDAEFLARDSLDAMLQGPLHSTLLLTLARADTGKEYEVEILRQHPSRASFHEVL